MEENSELEKELKIIEDDNLENWNIDDIEIEESKKEKKVNKMKTILDNVTPNFFKLISRIKTNENRYKFAVSMWTMFYCLQLSFKTTFREIKAAIFRVYHQLKDQKKFKDKLAKRIEKLKDKYNQ